MQRAGGAHQRVAKEVPYFCALKRRDIDEHIPFSAGFPASIKL
jgi:hypothetical protein